MPERRVVVAWGIALAVVLLLDAAIHLFCARLVLPHFERRLRMRAMRFSPHPDAETVTFRTRDGIRLRGCVVRTSAPARGVIIYCHEFSGQRWSFQHYCPADAIEGFDLVAFDFRNLGDSDSLPGYQPIHWTTDHDRTDVLAAVDFVRSRPEWNGLPMILAGVSRGSNAALAAAACCPEIESVIAVGSFLTHEIALRHFIAGIRRHAAWILRVAPVWHIFGTLCVAIRWSGLRLGARFLRIERDLRKLSDRPVLLISGTADSHIPLDIPEQMHGLIGPSAELVRIEGGRHNEERTADPHLYDAAVRNFLDRVVPVERHWRLSTQPATSEVASAA